MKTKFIYLLIALLMPFQAQAWEHWHHYHPGYYHGYWHHGWHGGRLGWWWINGAVWSWYERPVFEGPTAYIVQEPVVVQPAPVAPAPAPPPPAQSGANFYYCAAAKNYYPAVTSCPEGWVVTPAPPPAN